MLLFEVIIGILHKLILQEIKEALSVFQWWIGLLGLEYRGVRMWKQQEIKGEGHISLIDHITTKALVSSIFDLTRFRS